MPLHQALAAPGQVHEHLVDVAAHRGLLAGQLDRFGVHRVEGAGDLADLVAVGHRDRPDLQRVRRHVTALQGVIEGRRAEAVHVGAAVERLAADLASGAWDERYGRLRSLSELDVGLRLVVAELPS